MDHAAAIYLGFLYNRISGTNPGLHRRAVQCLVAVVPNAATFASQGKSLRINSAEPAAVPEASFAREAMTIPIYIA